MIMSAKALLDRNPEPTQEEMEYALDGNICRCGGYLKIFDAVRQAGQEMKQKIKQEEISSHATNGAREKSEKLQMAETSK